MPPTPFRVVLDTNVILRGLLNLHSPAGVILQAAERRALLPLLSKPLLDEYRAVLTDPAITDRFPQLTRKTVEIALRRLRYLSDYTRSVRTRFAFPRDPRDEMLIELAIAAEATHIVSSDADLLSLSTGRGEAPKRFRQRLPKTHVLTPADFLHLHGTQLAE